MTLTALEISEVNLDLAPRCSTPRCGRTAEVALHLVCGCIVLGCIPCRDVSKRNLQEGRGYKCRECRCEGRGTWAEIVLREVPL